MAFHCIKSWPDHDPPPLGNFCNNDGKSIKPQIVVDYNRHMGYADKGNRMANSYSINCRTWKWTKKLFFHLFDLAILNSYILFSSLGGGVRKFRIVIFGIPYWGIYWHTLDMNGMCKGQYEDHLLVPLKSLELKNVAGSIGLFHAAQRRCRVWRKRVSPEIFQ